LQDFLGNAENRSRTGKTSRSQCFQHCTFARYGLPRHTPWAGFEPARLVKAHQFSRL